MNVTITVDVTMMGEPPMMNVMHTVSVTMTGEPPMMNEIRMVNITMTSELPTDALTEQVGHRTSCDLLERSV